jgi:CheY-like chemotaxis protein
VARQATLLVVEDNDLARETVSELLEDDGYRVVATGSGGEALLAWEEQGGGFDAVLSDINLPDMSGLALLERLREAQPGVVFVVMTGRSISEPLFDELRDNPRTVLLEKPVNVKRLTDALRTLLQDPSQPH